MPNILKIKGSQITKERTLDSDRSYVNKIQISESVSLIMEDRNPYQLTSEGLLVPIEHNFSNPQIFYSDKTYYLVIEDTDNMIDGSDHYIEYVDSCDGNKITAGIYINYLQPITSAKNINNGYKGIIVGKYTRMNTILGYETKNQYSGFFRSTFLGARMDDVLCFEIFKGVHIPIGQKYEKKWNIIDNDARYHIFSCRFGYQGMTGENTEYTNLNNCLYISGVILDEDPTQLDLPIGKTYFEELD